MFKKKRESERETTSNVFYLYNVVVFLCRCGVDGKWRVTLHNLLLGSPMGHCRPGWGEWICGATRWWPTIQPPQTQSSRSLPFPSAWESLLVMRWLKEFGYRQLDFFFVARRVFCLSVRLPQAVQEVQLTTTKHFWLRWPGCMTSSWIWCGFVRVIGLDTTPQCPSLESGQGWRGKGLGLWRCAHRVPNAHHPQALP